MVLTLERRGLMERRPGAARSIRLLVPRADLPGPRVGRGQARGRCVCPTTVPAIGHHKNGARWTCERDGDGVACTQTSARRAPRGLLDPQRTGCQYARMKRTTISLPDDLAAALQREARRQRMFGFGSRPRCDRGQPWPEGNGAARPALLRDRQQRRWSPDQLRRAYRRLPRRTPRRQTGRGPGGRCLASRSSMRARSWLRSIAMRSIMPGASKCFADAT